MEINELLKTHSLVIFDGECNLCDSSVQFIIKRDPHAWFKFMPLQSSTAQKLLKNEYGENIPDSVILVDSSGIHNRSRAVLRIASQMKWPWKFFGAFRILPAILLNPFYRLLAAVRKKVWGSREVCLMPAPELTDRFIQD